jgi:hypothetical protein
MTEHARVPLEGLPAAIADGRVGLVDLTQTSSSGTPTLVLPAPFGSPLRMLALVSG